MRPSSIESICALVVGLLASGVLGAPSKRVCPKADAGVMASFLPYGPKVASSMTRLARCGPYRAFVVYANGTDNLYLDRLVPNGNGSALTATDGMGFSQFNAYEAANVIRSVRCKVMGPGKVKITGEADSGQTPKRFRFSIDVDTTKHCYQYVDTLGK